MKRFIVLGSLALSLVGVGAFAAENPTVKKDSPAKMSAPTPEMREKMAVGHEAMATCLRSDKPIKECHKEMRKQCHDTMGDNCPMMGKRGKGMMKHHKDWDEQEE